MKVFVCTYHTAKDGEFLVAESRVFKTKQEAMDFFNEWRFDEMFFIEEDGWTIDDDSEGHFEAGIFGDYCNNHTEGTVESQEI